jgi:transcriptional regulator with XRE-family HTH domain
MTEEELRLELGRRLRARRVAQDRTLASVALEAGLSVPYVANLESGRGNPTLGALHGLAGALDVPLAELLREEAAPRPPASLAEFTAVPRFEREVRRLAREEGSDASRVRAQLLAAMTGVAAGLPRPLDELDWHRVLDALVLVRRTR